jgi:hypothetical protein
MLAYTERDSIDLFRTLSFERGLMILNGFILTSISPTVYNERNSNKMLLMILKIYWAEWEGLLGTRLQELNVRLKNVAGMLSRVASSLLVTSE